MVTRHDCLAAFAPRRGSIAIQAAIALVLVLSIVGLALDTSHVRLTAQELQAAADSAALAAANKVLTDDPLTDYLATRQKAVAIALANEAANDGVLVDHNLGNAATGDVVMGVWDRNSQSFTPTVVAPNAVQVTARRTSASAGGSVNLLFGAIFGQATSEISRTAIATRGTGDAGAVLLVLHPSQNKAFDMRGTSYLNAPNGKIQINSTSASALYMNGAPGVPRLQAGDINIVGSFSTPQGTATPVPDTGQAVEPDYLLGLPYPDPTSMIDQGAITGPGLYQPGYYPGGIDFNGGSAVLAPGEYVIGAPIGIDLHGSALIEGDEVMLFLELGARVVTSGNDSGLDISAPSSGVYEGVAVFAHRESALDFDISGTGVFDVRGTMYMAKGHLSMDGVVDRRIGRIVIYTQQLRGNGSYRITGEGPPSGGPITTWLVE